MPQRVRKAVFPAAGLGTRFLPATKASPKEMLPLVDKPLIQYVVEEAVASGIQSIIIVTGRGKAAIEDHFDISFELERLLAERGKTQLLKEMRAISEMAHVSYLCASAKRLVWAEKLEVLTMILCLSAYGTSL
jgi:UTP--glucose-1-phosphate uridylyltransferase